MCKILKGLLDIWTFPPMIPHSIRAFPKLLHHKSRLSLWEHLRKPPRIWFRLLEEVWLQQEEYLHQLLIRLSVKVSPSWFLLHFQLVVLQTISWLNQSNNSKVKWEVLRDFFHRLLLGIKFLHLPQYFFKKIILNIIKLNWRSVRTQGSHSSKNHYSIKDLFTSITMEEEIWTRLLKISIHLNKMEVEA